MPIKLLHREDHGLTLFNVGSRVDMDGNILSHGLAAEDLELLCKDMTNANAFGKDGYSGGSKWLNDGVCM